MKKLVFLILALALLAQSPVSAMAAKKKDDKKDTKAAEVKAPPAQPQMTQEDAVRQELVTNITAMRNQEIRAAVMQQLLNEEVAKLMNTQAVFCDRYKLDVEKWRQGLYRYDEATAKFAEVPAQ